MSSTWHWSTMSSFCSGSGSRRCRGSAGRPETRPVSATLDQQSGSRSSPGCQRRRPSRPPCAGLLSSGVAGCRAGCRRRRVELLEQALAQAVGGVGVDVAAVGDEADDAPGRRLGPRPSGWRGCRSRRASSCSSPSSARRTSASMRRVERRVLQVRVVVVRAGLPGRVRRVADDDPDVGGLLSHDALVVADEDRRVEGVVVLVHLEGVGEHDAVEGQVLAALVVQAVEGGLDVDRGDVVGEQVDLVGVQLAGCTCGAGCRRR